VTHALCIRSRATGARLMPATSSRDPDGPAAKPLLSGATIMARRWAGGIDDTYLLPRTYIAPIVSFPCRDSRKGKRPKGPPGLAGLSARACMMPSRERVCGRSASWSRGGGGRRPPSDSIAAAITAVAERNPNERLMICRSWLLSCSTRAFENR